MLIYAASIAIWNKNKAVVTLTLIVWGTAAGFNLHSKSLPVAPVEDLESHKNVAGNSYCDCEWPISIILDPLGLSHSEVHTVWYSTELACGPVKSNSNALGFIATIIASMVLLLVILAGLLVMRGRGGGVFGLTRLIWKQVR